jgi:hypothetical protein
MNADLFIADMVTMRLESIEERRRLGSEPERNGGFVFWWGGGRGERSQFCDVVAKMAMIQRKFLPYLATS